MYLGLKYYSDITMSPITRLLSSNGISLDNLLCTYALSLTHLGMMMSIQAKAQDDEACLACMATAHLKQFLENLELPFVEDKKSKNPIQIFIDNRSAVDMGASFRDTQRTRHMMRRYHYVREGVESNQHALIWIINSAQVADMGTKILGRILLDSFKELIFVKVPE